MYHSINTAATGLTVFRTWIDVIAHNVANVNTTKPMDEDAFRAQFLQVRANEPGADGIGRGVSAVNVPEGDPNGRVSYDPDSPLADEEGYVRRPDMNLSGQMGNLIIAQRAFQANAQMVDRAKETYEAGIAIGKGI